MIYPDFLHHPLNTHHDLYPFPHIYNGYVCVMLLGKVRRFQSLMYIYQINRRVVIMSEGEREFGTLFKNKGMR